MDARGARIVRLIQDPDLGGDLLLVGLGLAAIYDFGMSYENGIDGIGDLLWSSPPDPHWKIRETFRRDFRRYQPETPRIRLCTASMIRREDLCGRPATTWGHTTDWDTGELAYIGACTRHYGWFDAHKRANWQGKPDVVPLPYANHGGVLARHFPRVDWPDFWRRLDPSWVEHPERTTRPRPDFSLVLGDGEGGLAAAPSLSLVPIGGVS